MPLLFKTPKTLFNFSLAFILKMRILDITNLLRNTDRLEKQKLICELFD